MLQLDHHIRLTPETIDSINLVKAFSDRDLERIGAYVVDGYVEDKLSRGKWEKWSSAALDLSMQMTKDKNFPWPGCSNVAFPLISIAALQFHARAYPALVGEQVCHYKMFGDDPTGERTARADRITSHMNYQLLEEDVGWEEGQDQLFMNLPIVGTAFKKTMYSSRLGYVTGQFVLARDLVVNYWAKNIDEAERKTHVIPLTKNDIYERVQRETFRDCLGEGWFGAAMDRREELMRLEADKRAGMDAPQPSDFTPFLSLEQHVSLDLDGDGYAEPYIVTVDRDTGWVHRIVARCYEGGVERTKSGKIICVRSQEFFTKYGFIPSPDGGLYDVAFGKYMGPLTEVINGIINQLNDAGSMSIAGGGFMGRGVKIRGGQYTFAPFEWKKVDSVGEDLAKNFWPFPRPEPSPVSLQLLNILINYTQRIGGAADVQAGENPGQNTPAETHRNMVSEGNAGYSDIFKRLWRCQKDELKKRYLINATTQEAVDAFRTFGPGASGMATREDYQDDPRGIVPAADPHLSTDSLRMAQATALVGRAQVAGGYNKEAVERVFLRSLKIPNIGEVYPGLEKMPPPPNPKVQVEQLKAESQKLKIKADVLVAIEKLNSEKETRDAQVELLKAQVAEILTGIGSAQAQDQLKIFEHNLKALQSGDESLRQHMELLMKAVETGGQEGGQGAAGGMGQKPGNPGGLPTPAGAGPGPGAGVVPG
jgi:chaperonin GroES